MDYIKWTVAGSREKQNKWRGGAMKHKTKQETEVTCIVKIQWGRKNYQKSYSEKQPKRWKRIMERAESRMKKQANFCK